MKLAEEYTSNRIFCSVKIRFEKSVVYIIRLQSIVLLFENLDIIAMNRTYCKIMVMTVADG